MDSNTPIKTSTPISRKRKTMETPTEITFTKTICYTNVLTLTQFRGMMEHLTPEQIEKAWNYMCKEAAAGQYDENGDDEEDTNGDWTETEIEEAVEEALDHVEAEEKKAGGV